MVEMFSLEQLIYIVVALVMFIFILHLIRLQRKWDIRCFIIGYYICVTFLGFGFFSLIIDRIDLIPELFSSSVIALLTLAFVWVELSKRPELRFGNFVPIVYKKHTAGLVYKAGYHVKEPEPSRFLRIKKVGHENLKFDERFSFSIDLSNIGYGEIMVHDYTFIIDGIRQNPIPLGKPPYEERLRLITQERHTIDLPPLYTNWGFHKIRVSVSAMTTKRSKEVWFYISKDFKKLRYVEMYPLKRLLSPFIKNRLKDP